VSVTAEIVLMWTAVTLYAAAAIALTVGTVFRLPKVATAGYWLVVCGIVPQVLAIVGRWVRVQHGPYLGFYEVISSYALLTIVAYLLVTLRYRGMRPVGIVVMPVAFLLLAGAMFADKSGMPITGTLASWWLAIHVTFAKLAYASFVMSFALAVVYLIRDRVTGTLAEVLSKLPRQDVIDDLSFKFVGIGFIFLGVMIAAGAIWANEAWGRYWGWDPIETWSLISWLVYAAYLHARLTLGWRGRRASWFAVVALPVLLFALMGVPIVYQSVHGAYLLGTG
jgi:cytochrome c-type biogenesis protein CcsB